MVASTVASPPRWFWIAAVLALVWTLLGVLAFVMDLSTSEAALAAMSETQREIYLARPQWLLVDYAVATLAALAGAIGLLLRRPWAVWAFAVSLAAVVLQFGYLIFGMNLVERLGAAAALPFPIVIFAIGVAMLWFARYAKHRGWIGAA